MSLLRSTIRLTGNMRNIEKSAIAAKDVIAPVWIVTTEGKPSQK
jgi:hypothetical protein